jgi:hypothetical protein
MMDISNWQSVYSTDQEYKAMIIINLLEENGIESHSVNKKDSNYLIGQIEIYVKIEDSEIAKSLLENSSY